MKQLTDPRAFEAGKGKVKKYHSFSDFILNASPEEKIKVFTEVAHKANQEQSRLFKEAKLKLKTN